MAKHSDAKTIVCYHHRTAEALAHWIEYSVISSFDPQRCNQNNDA